ncbi:MAG TPA: hypothetical protein VMF31_04940 [Solirubrobacterales bacterium]|nr:hypothetical protein [Solirubrobacterales bacterium]
MIERIPMRRAMTAAVILMMGLVAISSLVMTDTAAAKKKAKKAKVTLAIKTGNQAGLLKAKKLTVQVKSSAKAKVALTAAKGRNGKLFGKKSVNFKKRGKKTISLPLTVAGRKELAKCGAQQVKVTGKYRKGKKKATATRSKRLAKDASRCKDPVEYVTVPLGDNPDRCDFLDSTVCLQPFPNDYYTKADPSTDTGKRLDLHAESTPANTAGAHVDVTDINRGDGFSPGNAIVLKVPGLDTPAAFEKSGLVPLDDLHAYDDPSQAVIVIDAETGVRQPIYAELDANPTTVDPKPGDDGGINTNPTNTEDVNLIVRPAENFDYGKRYIVAFRNLKDANGQPIESPIGFRAYRDNLPTQQDVVENRRPHMEQVIGDVVTKGGVERSSLYMAWDFTIASQKSVTSRALQIRDDAFERLGDTNLANRTIEGESPEVVISAVCNQGDAPTCGTGPGGNDLGVPSGDMLRYVEGYLNDVPCYLNVNGCPPLNSKFNFKADGSIDFDDSFTMDVPFRCIIPKAVQPGGAGTAVVPGQTGIYGHGLLGTYEQATSAGPRNVAHGGGGVWCGANWDGFSLPDLATIVPSLQDMSNFHRAVDRMQQGFVNFMLLQRAMIHEDGFAQQEAFQLDDDGNPATDKVSVIDVSDFPDTRGQYMGISQGGIMGGALMALTPDSDYGVLGVPGMNYSTLLQRSVDSDRYFKDQLFGLYKNYPDLAERPMLLGLMQLLWDRGEANGYAQSMTSDPLPNTPPHDVLMRVAFGDHQVSNYTAEAEARTIGASIYSPALNAGRHWEADPFLGMSQQSTFPFDGGSMLVYYDSGPVSFTEGTESDVGIGTPPLQNVPPREEWGFGGDPHEHPRRSADGINHAVTFLRDGTINSCATITPEVGDPTDAHCYANGYTGP